MQSLGIPADQAWVSFDPVYVHGVSTVFHVREAAEAEERARAAERERETPPHTKSTQTVSIPTPTIARGSGS